jgi:predicted transposase YbfD/YdcC
VLGTVAVERKSNEIPAARTLLEKLGPLDGKFLMLDALHTYYPKGENGKLAISSQMI